MISPNWETYRKIFPDRYTQTGYFDKRTKEIVSAVTKTSPPPHFLDIGGGVCGTQALNAPPARTFGLDPFVSLPDWQTPTSWEAVDAESPFALIAARGSICYLTKDELRRLPSLLTKGGTLIFNTFSSPKEISRPFTNLETNIQGWETTKIEGDKITHTLEFKKAGKLEKISHQFFHHPPDFWKKIFGPREITLEPYKRNSLLLILHG